MDSGSTTASALGKRKSRTSASYILHFTSSSEAEASEFEQETEPESLPDTSLPALVDGKLVFTDPKISKRYTCTFSGCFKSYSKLCRLEEHERSHTGQRPFVCATCNKSYLRESHLQAHIRSHMPESARPLVCSLPSCGKRFWTSQHLSAHVNWHNGSKQFPCVVPGCNEAFGKHNQLKAHVAAIHSPPGTKPFQCTYKGCPKSFSMNQHLKIHLKTHDEKRYTCSYSECLPEEASEPRFFPNWTSLQHHIRTAHPPTCPHPSCNARTFASRSNLRSHLKLHEQRELEANLALQQGRSADVDEPPAKRRRGGEVGRDWVCMVPDCTKDFKSQKALTTHVNVNHLGIRKHICPYQDCRRAFGFKHLLQRHLARVHSNASSSGDGGNSSSDDVPALPPSIVPSSAQRNISKILQPRTISCPYPNLEDLCASSSAVTGAPACEYAFSRAYDLRRHLNAAHGVVIEKDIAEKWVRDTRK